MTKHYIRFDPDSGEIVQTLSCPEEFAALNQGEGEHWVEGLARPETHYVSDGQIAAYTPAEAAAKLARPAHSAEWSNDTMQWVDLRDLAAARSQAVTRMRNARDAQINSTFIWDGSTFDSDQTSQTRIHGLAWAASIPSFTPKAWRLADNSWRVLSAEDAIAVFAALGVHLETAFQHFAAKEAECNAAETVEAADAVVW